MSDNQIRAHFKYCQIKTRVQTARESHDLDMDFRLFDNDAREPLYSNSAVIAWWLQSTSAQNNVHICL